MTDDELLIAWREADCAIEVERVREGVRISFGDDPLNFIVLAPKALEQLVIRLQKAASGYRNTFRTKGAARG